MFLTGSYKLEFDPEQTFPQTKSLFLGDAQNQFQVFASNFHTPLFGRVTGPVPVIYEEGRRNSNAVTCEIVTEESQTKLNITLSYPIVGSVVVDVYANVSNLKEGLSGLAVNATVVNEVSLTLDTMNTLSTLIADKIKTT